MTDKILARGFPISTAKYFVNNLISALHTKVKVTISKLLFVISINKDIKWTSELANKVTGINFELTKALTRTSFFQETLCYLPYLLT